MLAKGGVLGAEPVAIQCQDRDTVCRAIVVPENGEVLLG